MSIRVKHWPCASPSPSEIRTAREAVGMSEALAAETAGMPAALPWIEAERGRRILTRAHWSLFLLATDQHPTLRLAAR